MRQIVEADPRAAWMFQLRAVMSLASAIVAARPYPTVKYATGHGKACTRSVVAGAPIVFDDAMNAVHHG